MGGDDENSDGLLSAESGASEDEGDAGVLKVLYRNPVFQDPHSGNIYYREVAIVSLVPSTALGVNDDDADEPQEEKPEETTFQCGDCVFASLERNDENSPVEILLIWQDKYGDGWFEGRRYLGRKDHNVKRALKQGKSSSKGPSSSNGNFSDMERNAELFESDICVEASVECIENIIRVSSLEDFRRTLSSSKDGENSTQEEISSTHFWARYFVSKRHRSVTMREISRGIDVNGKIRLYSERAKSLTILTSFDWTNVSEASPTQTTCEQDANGETTPDTRMRSRKRQRNEMSSSAQSEDEENEGHRSNETSIGSRALAGKVLRQSFEGLTNRGNELPRWKEKLQAASKHLQLGSTPDTLPCREYEKEQIQSVIENAVTEGNSGAGGSLYISGMPGTGKTATVKQVIRELRHSQSIGGQVSDFLFIEINGMKLSDPKQVYSILWREISGSGIMKAPARACFALEQYFSKPPQGRGKATSKARKPIIVLVDELDCMLTRKQTVLYNLFDWPTRPHSSLLVIAIANTMDLPERLLPKINSRLGLGRIVFEAYTRAEIEEIVHSRIGSLHVFQADAVEYIARKVAGFSGDIRRALQVCRRAAELCITRLEKAAAESGAKTSSEDKQTDERGLVTIEDIILAVKQLSASPHLDVIVHGQVYEKIFFLACVKILNGKKTEEAPLEDVHDYMGWAARLSKRSTSSFSPPLDVPSIAIAEDICMKLESRGLIEMECERGKRYPKIRLNMQPDDVVFALRSDPLRTLMMISS